MVNLLHNIKKAGHEIEPRAEIILFGSRTRDEAKDGSDWAILILMLYPIDLDSIIEANRKTRILYL